MLIYCKLQFIPVIKAVFSASLLQSSESHDPSEISLICWFDDQETFLIIINVVQLFLCGNCDTCFFQDSLKNRKFKKQHLFEIEIFHYGTFDQFMHIDFFKKYKFLHSSVVVLAFFVCFLTSVIHVL